MSLTSVAVIIVNYGTADLAIQSAMSVLSRQHGGRDVTLHLVDNASPGADAKTLQSWHDGLAQKDRVTLYLEQANHGFGRGTNLVLERLAAAPQPPDYVMLLNPDARLANEAIDILATTLDREPTVVAAGSGIAKPDGTPVVAAFRFPSVMSEFTEGLSFGPITRLTKAVMPLAPDHPPGPVDWVSGAAFMARLDALAGVGFFDPDFFLYFEEVEMMHRLRQSGGEILYVPEAHVLHFEGASTGVASDERAQRRRPGYWYDSWRLYHVKTSGRAGALRAAFGRAFGTLCHYPLCWVRGRTSRAPHRYLRDFYGRVIRPLLGLGIGQ